MHIPVNDNSGGVEVASAAQISVNEISNGSAAVAPTTAAVPTPYTQPAELFNPADGYGFGTNAVHAGQHPDPTTGAVIPPLSLSTTFRQSAVGVHQGFEYSRSDNPTRHAFEEAVTALEGGKHGLAFSSGSATTATVMHAIPRGSHIISINDVYGGTYRYFTKVANATGHEISFVDLTDVSHLDGYFRDNTKLVWLESPTNPTLRIADIAAIAERAHRHGVLVVVDNTFLSPYFQRPLSLGADIVVHSGTKYLNGHSDVVIGVAVVKDDVLADRLRFLQNAIGAVPSPFDCFLANRGLKTLHVRMRQHERNAFAVAQALEAHPAVEEVIYGGLPSHPQHALAKRQQSGFGGMVTFRVRGNLATAERFLTAVRIFVLAESLGGVESLCELPASMTHGAVSAEDRAKLGISDTLIRLSCGIEETEDLVADIRHALAVAAPEFPLKEADAPAGLASNEAPIGAR